MTTPNPSGSGFTLGAYRVRILWLRILFSAFLALWLIGFCTDRPSDPPAGPDPDAPAPLPRLEDHLSPRDRTARAALQRPVRLAFEKAPLEDVLDTLRALTELNFVYDPEVRGFIEDHANTVRVLVRDIPAERALRLALAPDLSFHIRHGLVVISDDPAPALFTEYYDLRDIIDGRLRERGGAALNPEPLYDLIERVLGPAADSSTIAFYEHVLTLRSDLDSHRAVCALIRRLRSAPGRLPPEPAWIRRLQAALDQTVDFQRRRVGLSELLAFFQDELGIAIRTSSDVIPDKRVIDLRLKRVPARVLLSAALEQLSHADRPLAASPREGGLVIHHRGDQLSDFALRVFAIQDLYPEDPEEIEASDCVVIDEEPRDAPESVLYPEDLIELLRAETGELLWDEPASIRVHRGQLIVWQTAAMHRALDKALARMRRVRWQSHPGFRGAFGTDGGG